MSGLLYRGSGTKASLDLGIQTGTVYHAFPMRRLVSSPLAIILNNAYNLDSQQHHDHLISPLVCVGECCSHTEQYLWRQALMVGAMLPT